MTLFGVFSGSFSNSHVAVGFVDLGILLAAKLEDSARASSEKPLRFVGIESSAYAVAKTLVLWQLLTLTPKDAPKQEHDDHLRSVLQAWFSAGWDETTSILVKEAVNALCSLDIPSLLNPAVNGIIQHWKEVHDCPLPFARKHLEDSTSEAFSCVGHLQNKRDRMALVKYELTRDFALAPGQKAVCGNFLMFSCPDGTPPVNYDETVFSALNFADIMDILRQSSPAEQMTVVDAALASAMKKIEKLAFWATSKSITIELYCSRFEDMVDEIADKFQPYTMSWSNLCDYVDYEDFHKKARQCSTNADTIHFGYSMNWSINVFGVNIMDYAGPQLAEARAEIIDAANDTRKKCYEALGWEPYLRLPPPDNPINTTSYNLQMVRYKTWVDYFFSIAKKQGPCNIGSVEHAMLSPLSTTGESTVFFTWTYDPDIAFQKYHDGFPQHFFHP